jgi:hypothetical protein
MLLLPRSNVVWAMPYTLWMHGELLGETGLDQPGPFAGQRLGTLRPTPLGMEKLPALCGYLSAVSALKDALLRRGLLTADQQAAGMQRAIESTPEGARVRKIVWALSALELRDDDGTRVQFRCIAVSDVQEMIALGAPLDPAVASHPNAPRFLISTTVSDNSAAAARAGRRLRPRWRSH